VTKKKVEIVLIRTTIRLKTKLSKRYKIKVRKLKSKN
jgi:hypothetical protein